MTASENHKLLNNNLNNHENENEIKTESKNDCCNNQNKSDDNQISTDESTILFQSIRYINYDSKKKMLFKEFKFDKLKKFFLIFKFKTF
jgi:hypothetical protein